MWRRRSAECGCPHLSTCGRSRASTTTRSSPRSGSVAAVGGPRGARGAPAFGVGAAEGERRVPVPSVPPELQCRVRLAVTASRSRSKWSAKPVRPGSWLASTASIQTGVSCSGSGSSSAGSSPGSGSPWAAWPAGAPFAESSTGSGSRSGPFSAFAPPFCLRLLLGSGCRARLGHCVRHRGLLGLCGRLLRALRRDGRIGRGGGRWRRRDRRGRGLLGLFGGGQRAAGWQRSPVPCLPWRWPGKRVRRPVPRSPRPRQARRLLRHLQRRLPAAWRGRRRGTA